MRGVEVRATPPLACAGRTCGTPPHVGALSAAEAVVLAPIRVLCKHHGVALERETRRVWRVRRWVRLLTVLFLAPVLWPATVNPDWADGMPADQWPAVTCFYAVFALNIWSAFRARIELDRGQVRVVNPWGTCTFPVTAVTGVQLGKWGVVFFRREQRLSIGFAVQGIRYADVAFAVTGVWPDVDDEDLDDFE